MDELLLSKVRLSVVAELLASEWATFTDLKRSTAASDGNLGGHVAKLVEAGYVQEQKRFVGRRPQSRFRLTRAGRTALLRHVDELQKLVESGREGSRLRTE